MCTVRCAVITFARDGETHLVALIPLLLVKLRQRIPHGLIVFGTVAEDVNGEVDGMAERKLVGNALACQRKTVGYFC